MPETTFTFREHGINAVAFKVGVLGGSFQSLSRNLRISSYGFFFLGGALTALGVGLSLAVKSTVSSAVQFERTLIRLKAISGATITEMTGLTEAIFEMSAEYGVAATTITEGMTVIAQAGTEIGSIGEVMEASLMLGVAAGEDANAMALQLVTTLHQFNLETKESARVTNVMALAEIRSTLNMKGYGQAMLYAGSMANFVGMEVEETSLILASVNNALGNAGLSGRSFAMSLRNLVHPTQEAERMMRRLGIATVWTERGTFDYMGTMLSVKKGLESINYGTKQWNAAEKAKVISLMFGARAARFTAVATEDYDRINREVSEGLKLLEADLGKNTFINGLVAQQLDATQVKQNRLGASFIAMKVILGESLIPAYRKLLGTLTSVTELVKKAAKWYPPLTAAIMLAVIAMSVFTLVTGTAILTLGAFAAIVGFLAPLGLASAITGLTMLMLAFGQLLIVVGILTLSIYLLYKVFTNYKELGVTKGVLYFVSAIGLAIAGLALLKGAITGFKGFARKIFPAGEKAGADTGVESLEKEARAQRRPTSLFRRLTQRTYIDEVGRRRFTDTRKFAPKPLFEGLRGRLGGIGRFLKGEKGGVRMPTLNVSKLQPVVKLFGKLSEWFTKIKNVLPKIKIPGWLTKIASKLVILTVGLTAVKSIADEIIRLYKEGVSISGLWEAAKNIAKDVGKVLYDIALSIITLPMDIGAWIAEKLGAVDLADKLRGWTSFLHTGLWAKGMEGMKKFKTDALNLFGTIATGIKELMKNIWDFKIGWKAFVISLDFGWLGEHSVTIPGKQFSLSSYHTGGVVPRDTAAMLRKGEKVLTPAQLQSGDGGPITLNIMPNAKLTISNEIDLDKVMREIEINTMHTIAKVRKYRGI